ncbi:MAG: hypothetical protein ABI026_02480 [Gemmatimonadaceae bacterium]
MSETTMTQVLKRIILGRSTKPVGRSARWRRRALPGMMLACAAALALPACSDTTAPAMVQVTLPIQDLSVPDSVGPGATIPVNFSVARGACTTFSRYTVEFTPTGAAITAWGTQPSSMPTCTQQLILIPLHADVPTRACGGNVTITARQPSGIDSITREVKVAALACATEVK